MPRPTPKPAPSVSPHVDLERIRALKSFPQLVKYLRDDLDWPIDADAVDDLTFDYTPDELGLDAKSAVKVKEIKQLRPLTSTQPWGIFFVNFEPGKLPVVVLRRILRSLVLNKRGSAKKSDRAAWDRRDLLFISAYGEGDSRAITFAHFADPPPDHDTDLPTLKVLGWDDDDTPLHLDLVHKGLTTHLRWPADPGAFVEPIGWRNKWARAFTVAHGEVVRTSKELAVRLAELAARIRKRARTVLNYESAKGELRTLHKAFREALIHDLTEDDFADMYAQTIAYGLLTAAVSRHAPDAPGSAVTADSAVDMVPVTNPFLKEMLERFLKAGGRNGHAGGGAKSPHKGIDFDELGVSEVVDLLRAANMTAVLADFGNRNPLEDPVIHFYELFLKEYDPKKRMQRGVFYTPRPVVSFIVRSVHEILQKEFGLEDGLASTVTWAELVVQASGLHESSSSSPSVQAGLPAPQLRIPDGTNPDSDFVQILDPATGTGTFLVEVIDVIHKTLVVRWEREKKSKAEILQLWNEYVPRHLLPRLHGYELMPAPYAIAHMKIGLKLHETGYGFGSDERVRVYLTNALEPAQDFSDRLEFDVPALAHEAEAVNSVKRQRRFSVVIGNPPYSVMSSNLSAETRALINAYRHVDGERIREKSMLRLEMQLQDDYIKFLRLSEIAVTAAGYGIVGLIVNHSFLDNPTLRGVRYSLRSTFPQLRLCDLHGNSRKSNDAMGQVDENVFDIQQGVAVLLASRVGERADILLSDLRGDRESKYRCLQNSSVGVWKIVNPTKPLFLFAAHQGGVVDEYENFVSLNDAMPTNSGGIMSGRDEFAFDFDREPLVERIAEFCDARKTDVATRERFGIRDASGYVLRTRRRVAVGKDPRAFIRPTQFRPFDYRFVAYSRAFLTADQLRIMRHLLDGRNVAIVTTRQTKESWGVFVTRDVIERKFVAAYDPSSVFPLFLRDAETEISFGTDGAVNFSGVFNEQMVRLCKGSGAILSDAAEKSFHYIYGVLHSPSYRARYARLLLVDFPRIPVPRSEVLFTACARAGAELASLHLLQSLNLDRLFTTFIGGLNPGVDKVTWANNTVWLDKAQTRGFHGVHEAVWNFHIGGYQVCQKWLKDRKGRTLTKADIEHYQKIVVALSETIRIMAEIDTVIESHGGWPGAFVTGPVDGGPAGTDRPAPMVSTEASATAPLNWDVGPSAQPAAKTSPFPFPAEPPAWLAVLDPEGGLTREYDGIPKTAADWEANWQMGMALKYDEHLAADDNSGDERDIERENTEDEVTFGSSLWPLIEKVWEMRGQDPVQVVKQLQGWSAAEAESAMSRSADLLKELEVDPKRFDRREQLAKGREAMQNEQEGIALDFLRNLLSRHSREMELALAAAGPDFGLAVPAVVGTKGPASSGGAGQKVIGQARKVNSTPSDPDAGPTRQSIDDIEFETILCEIRAVLGEADVMDRDALVKAVAERLGFERVGSKIGETIERAVNAASRRKISIARDGVVEIMNKSIDDYGRDELVETLESAMRAAGGPALWDRAEAVKYAATYLGFRRVGPRIAGEFKSAMNAAIRRGVLVAEGGQVRRGER